jgi:hypothetical protein
MKRLLLSAVFVGLSVAPALAGGGGAIFDDSGKALIETVKHLGKLLGVF